MSIYHLLALKSIDWLGIPRDGAAASPQAADQQGQILSIILFAVSLVLILWLFARFQSRMRSPQRPHRPYRMFGQLLKHHDLGARDRMMLLLLAGCQGMKQPALLLLSPGLFAQYAEAWLTHSAVGTRWPGARQRLVHIAQQVFREDAAAGADYGVRRP